ncbi:MAG: DUF1592 domain-containing protein [Sandaracinus sp.]
MSHARASSTALVLALALASCQSASGGVAPPPPSTPQPLVPAASALRRLSVAQYGAALRDAFGDDITVPSRSALEPDVEASGYLSIDASSVTISRRGVGQYEAAAYNIAHQAMDATHRTSLVTCAPSAAVDATCARTTLEPIGRHLYRRPLEPSELDDAVSIATQAATALGDFYAGLEFGIAYFLQSPSFLFREELGAEDPDAPGELRYTGYEMASRLSFFLWNAPPDAELLDAAGSGQLDTAEGVRAAAERLLADPRAEDGVRELAYEWLALSGLDDLSKDPTVYTQISPEVGPAAREETMRVVAHVFTSEMDARDLMTTRDTFLDRKLASIYLVRAPREPFGLVTLPESSPRAGLLGHLSILALNAHPIATSPTLRGKFIRERLLCDPVPPPPVGVNTQIPEPSPDALTLRDRLLAHQEVAYCAGCHRRLDGIGLGLEAFDALGRFREEENGVPIDASGELDGRTFEDARGLGLLIRDDPRFAECMVRQAYRVASGHLETEGEAETIDRLYVDFATHGYSLRRLFEELVVSDGFRRAVPQP